MTNLVELIEEVVLPRFRRLCVARFASRHFLLVGHRDRPRAEYEVLGPFDSLHDARNHAHALQLRAYEGEQTGVAL